METSLNAPAIAVDIRLPLFWTADLQLWLLQSDIAGGAPTTTLHDIQQQISHLVDTVAVIQARSTPEERQHPAAQQSICWYHRKHNNAARKCIVPCDYARNGSGRY
ncbi:hypothetical protein MRX96_035864 [Rhipicephalus microplus]